MGIQVRAETDSESESNAIDMDFELNNETENPPINGNLDLRQIHWVSSRRNGIRESREEKSERFPSTPRGKKKRLKHSKEREAKKS